MVALYFVVIIALPAALGIYVALRGMHRTRRCPYCADDTIPIRSRVRRILSRLVPGAEFQRRWCPGCLWEGTVRAPPPERSTRAAPMAARAADQVDIRQLYIDGRAWKVMVECWADGGRWLGRFVFVGPDGHPHVDDQSSLEGDSALEILSSALSMPDQALAGRIRRTTH
jgi:hypothetical protein